MKLKIAQWGTKHAHAAAVTRAILDCKVMEFVGVYEQDSVRWSEVQQQEESPYAGVHLIGSKAEMLGDASISAIVCEGANDESLDMAQQIVSAGKHLWLDKPAGEDWEQWVGVVAAAKARSLHIQLGYMLRYSPAFIQVSEWARSGFLGDVFKVRGDMSKVFPKSAFARFRDYPHAGGIFYDLGGHMVDMVLWMMKGCRPSRVDGRFFATQTEGHGYPDNTLAVLEFEGGGLGIVDISLRQHGNHRRFEVFGTKGCAPRGLTECKFA